MSRRQTRETRPQAPVALPRDHLERLRQAQLSLEGLAHGDAFGEGFFLPPARARYLIERREAPRLPPWRTTDDTAMAISVVATLASAGRIDADGLAVRFGAAYLADPHRGYGPTAHEILADIGRGVPWAERAKRPFGGQGSYGNGGAMRVAPLGAYLGDADLEEVARQARLSAAVTHAHPEGQAGAVAIAIAAALYADGRAPARDALFTAVLEHVRQGQTRKGIARAAEASSELSPREAAGLLGSGRRVSAQDTVPYVLWILGRGEVFEEALWTTVAGGGDLDTTCAMVGGVRILVDGLESIPEAWRDAREKIPRFAEVE